MRFFDMFLATMFLIICVLLIVVVLLQKGRGGGLGAAFGGAASTAFGTRVGDVFTWVTIVLTALFLLFAIGTTMWFRPAPEQVMQPFFTPAGRNKPFTEPVDVTIACPTSGAQIYYTLDESIPDKDSTLYESPVRVEPGHHLIARAYRPGRWTPSRVVGDYYGPKPEEQQATKPAPGEGDEILGPVLPAEPDKRPAETQPSPLPSGQPGA